MPIYRVPQCLRNNGNRLFLGFYWKTSRATRCCCWGYRKVNDGEASRAMIFNDGLMNRRVRDFLSELLFYSIFCERRDFPVNPLTGSFSIFSVSRKGKGKRIRQLPCCRFPFLARTEKGQRNSHFSSACRDQRFILEIEQAI